MISSCVYSLGAAAGLNYETIVNNLDTVSYATYEVLKVVSPEKADLILNILF